MTLDGSARVWDPTGSAAGDQIVMISEDRRLRRDGHVATTRMPDDKGSPRPCSPTTEIMQARAQHMTSAENNQKMHYEGNAVAWQGANRVEADRIDIDRGRHVLEAHGKVVSQFIDKDKDKDKDADKAKNAGNGTRPPKGARETEERGLRRPGSKAAPRPARFSPWCALRIWSTRGHAHRPLPGRRGAGASRADRGGPGDSRFPARFAIRIRRSTRPSPTAP